MGNNEDSGAMDKEIRRWRYVHQDNESLDCEVRARVLWVRQWGERRAGAGMGEKELGRCMEKRRWVAPEHARDMEWVRMKEGE
jgi:hypothetical protein